MSPFFRSRISGWIRLLVPCFVVVVLDGCMHFAQQRASASYERRDFERAIEDTRDRCLRLELRLDGKRRARRARLLREHGRCLVDLGRLHWLSSQQFAVAGARVDARGPYEEARVTLRRAEQSLEEALALFGDVTDARTPEDGERVSSVSHARRERAIAERSCAELDLAVAEGALGVASWNGRDPRVARELLRGAVDRAEENAAGCERRWGLLVLAKLLDDLALVEQDPEKRDEGKEDALGGSRRCADPTACFRRSRAHLDKLHGLVSAQDHQRKIVALGAALQVPPDRELTAPPPPLYDQIGGTAGIHALLCERHRRLDGPSHGFDPLFVIAGRPPRSSLRLAHGARFMEVIRRKERSEQFVETILEPPSRFMVRNERFVRQVREMTTLKTSRRDYDIGQRRVLNGWRRVDRRLWRQRARAEGDHRKPCVGDRCHHQTRQGDDPRTARRMWKDIEDAFTREQGDAEGSAILLEFVRYKVHSWSESYRYGVYVLHFSKARGRPKVVGVDLGDADVIDELADEFYRTMSLRLEEPQTIAHRLYERLLDRPLQGPLREALERANVVYVVPVAGLERVSFAALFDGERYLVEHREFRYLTHAYDLVSVGHRHRADRAGRSAVVVAATGKGEHTLVGAEEEATKVAEILGIPASAGGEPMDCEALARGREGAVLIGGQATKQCVVDLVDSPEILHIAAHGKVNTASERRRELTRKTQEELGLRFMMPLLGRGPRVSWTKRGLEKGAAKDFEHGLEDLRLARIPAPLEGPAELAGSDDLRTISHTQLQLANGQVLTAHDFLDGEIDVEGTKLVVLSACGSGLTARDDDETTVSADRVVDLRQVLLDEGAQAVVGALWEVSDELTADLMASYYRRLIEQGQGRSSALWQVQRELLADDALHHYHHPYYWASFTVTGDWRPLVASE